MMKKVFMVVGCILLLLSCRSQAIQINVHFDQLFGLAPEDRVLFEANAAGRVESIHYNNDGSYDVRLEIDEGFVHAVTEFTRFRVVDDAAFKGRKAVAMTLLRSNGKPLSDGATIKGEEPEGLLGDQIKQGLEEGFEFFKKQVDQFADDLKNVPRSEAYRNLKKSLSDLADELGRSEKKARQKLKDEWLPLIEREMEELKRQLRDDGHEDKTAPLQEEIDRIRNI